MTLIRFCKALFFLAMIMPLLSCNHLFYYPNQQTVSTPDEIGLSYEDLIFESADGTRLHGWFIPSQTEPVKGTVVQLHGNAGNISSHYLSIVWLAREGYHVFAFDYRGYGKSEGKPGVHGPVQDSIAALEEIRRHPRVDPNRLFVIGQSLGGALAIAALAKGSQSGIQAVVIENTFSSYQRITRDKLDTFWLTWGLQWPLSLLLIRDTYSPEELIPELSSLPVLLIHGRQDRIVEYYHSSLLYEAAKPPVTFWSLYEGQHVDAFTQFGRLYRDELLEFFEKPKDYEPTASFLDSGLTAVEIKR